MLAIICRCFVLIPAELHVRNIAVLPFREQLRERPKPGGAIRRELEEIGYLE